MHSLGVPQNRSSKFEKAPGQSNIQRNRYSRPLTIFSIGAHLRNAIVLIKQQQPHYERQWWITYGLKGSHLRELSSEATSYLSLALLSFTTLNLDTNNPLKRILPTLDPPTHDHLNLPLIPIHLLHRLSPTAPLLILISRKGNID